jgi:3-deoxy-manno-octulosonate cytidylyltransferase (CMP-KDO synthetase)
MSTNEALNRLVIVAIIPARFGSTRLPGKPLSEIHGKPLIQHVHARVRLARRVERVVVATDDDRIVEAVRGFGGECVLTSSTHATGTDRVAEAARGISADVIVNVQGDEPLLDPGWIDAAVEPLLEEETLPIATLSVPITEPDELLSAAVVKVVVGAGGDALYFSRSPVPLVRLSGGDLAAAAAETVARGLAHRHLGLYACRPQALARWASLPVSPLEETESLEQLRALSHGMRIRVVPVTTDPGPAVDTPEDLERVRALIEARNR